MAIIAVSLLCFIALALGNIRATAPTHDETTHLAAGWSYLAYGDFRLNTEHPPLVKLIAALPLQSDRIWPSWQTENTRVALASLREAWSEAARDDRAQWRFAHRLFFSIRNGAIDLVPSSERIPHSAFLNDATAIFRAARTTLLLLIAPLFFALIGFWAFELWGAWGAVLPVALFAFDPNFIAHTGLVTTDAGLALLMCASIYFFWRCSRRFTVWNVAAFSLATALAHITKFSAVILWPVLLLVAILGAREQLLRLFVCAAIALAVTVSVIWACYALPSHSAHAATTYLTGFSKALYDTLGRTAYLRGELDRSGAGFRTYFLWAILLKTPVVTLVCFFAAAWWCLRNRRRDLLFVFVPPLVYFLVASGGTLNIGHRHILPIYPFLYVSCGALPRKWLAAAAVAALSAFVVLIPFTPLWGNHLAYFNELAGGPRNGSRYLIDSNLDWGQDLPRLGQWIESHGIREPIDLAYFGTAEPRYYGVSFFNFSDHYLFAPCQPLGDAKSKIFAISVNELVRGRDGDRWAFRDFLHRRHARLVGRAGMTIEIYEMAAVPGS